MLFTAVVFAGLLAIGQSAHADVKVPALFTDGMVLQQGSDCHVWGTAAPGEKVMIELEQEDVGQAALVTAGEDGKWNTKFPKLKAGGPYKLTIKGKNEITIKDVYVGDVWICSGQSNMEWPLRADAKAKQAIEDSKNPNIRLFTVKKTATDKPATDVPQSKPDTKPADVHGRWQECNPDTVPNFAAVAYYFGRDLQKARNVPIGLIHTSWGGTAAEEWTSQRVLDANPDHKGKHPRQTKLYNGMIAPLMPFAIKGVIWYQGESNAGRAALYRELFPLMIKNWRDDWKQGEFPFLFVQLAPWQKIVTEPQESAWAELREAQLLTSLKVPNTAMAVITDVGDEKDIHPRQKEPVGARLALAARALAYKEKIEYSGPVYDSKEIDGNKIVLSFKHLGKGLEMKGEALQGFTIAGEDQKFYNAKAEIKGDKVVVWCDKVEKPIAVRYGWANCPVINLWNKDGLPASPFRTDDFPMVTAPKK
jgi:sialate O-acetylesterase